MVGSLERRKERKHDRECIYVCKMHVEGKESACKSVHERDTDFFSDDSKT